MKHTVQIDWDAGFEGMTPDTQTYTFGSRAELDAFMEGVAATRDTMSHIVLYDSRNDPQAPDAIQIVCRTCGSAEVLRDAFAEWDPDEQEWTLASVYDDAVCEGRCGGETKLDEVNLIEWKQNQEKETSDGEA